MCVCVNHLKRCKTSMFRSHFDDFEVFVLIFVELLICIIRRGMERTYEAPSNEAPHMILGYHQGRLVTYLQHHFIFRQWRPAKPSTGMTHFQSTCFFLYGCRNLTSFPINDHGLSCIRTFSCFEQGRRKFLHGGFSPQIFQTNLSVLLDCFLHVRCIPHQKFDKMFLSKCVTHAGSVKVV